MLMKKECDLNFAMKIPKWCSFNFPVIQKNNVISVVERVERGFNYTTRKEANKHITQWNKSYRTKNGQDIPLILHNFWETTNNQVDQNDLKHDFHMKFWNKHGKKHLEGQLMHRFYFYINVTNPKL